MSYREGTTATDDAEIRIPFHSRKPLAAVLATALASICAFATYNARAFHVSCRTDPGSPEGVCQIDRVSHFRVDHLRERFGSLWMNEDPEHPGGYHLGVFANGAMFQLPPIANEASAEQMRRSIETHASAGLGSSAFGVDAWLVSRSSVWFAWASGVLVLLVLTASAGRLRRETVVRLERKRNELRWHEGTEEPRTVPVSALLGFDIDQSYERNVLVAVTPGARVPIAVGPIDVIAAARDQLEARVAYASA
jgi:hypothetical protein